MSAGLDGDFVRKRYQSLTDQELLYTVTHNAHGLTSEAELIIREELARRDVDGKLGAAIEAQNRTYTIEEIDQFCRIIETLYCPKCDKRETKLTAVIISRTVSFIFATQSTTQLAIGCPTCLATKNRNALIYSLVLGWWGAPWGPIRTIGSINNYVKADAAMRNGEINDVMRGFVLANIGLLTIYKADIKSISTIIFNQYHKNPLMFGLK
jgi:predicted nucleic-acid-binding Zn-ribbon protein